MVQTAAMPTHIVQIRNEVWFSLVKSRRKNSTTQHLLRPIAIKFKILDENTSYITISSPIDKVH